MKDFTKLKYHMAEATDRLIHLNDEIQELPDKVESVQSGDEVFKILQSLFPGFVEFTNHFDTAYDPFKPVVEKMKRNAKH